MVLATKCGLVWHLAKGTHFFDQSGKPVYRYLGPESIRHELEQSLRRLRTDYIDLYQTHWQDATTPLEDTIGELQRLKTEGKIRAIGASNISPEHLQVYQDSGSLDSIQEKYSMLDRGLEEQLLPRVRPQRGLGPGLLPPGPGSADREDQAWAHLFRGRPANQQPPFQPPKTSPAWNPCFRSCSRSPTATGRP